MDITNFILQGFQNLPLITVSINNVNLECIFNQSNHLDDKTFGGYSPSVDFTVMFRTSDLQNPKSLKGKILTKGTETYRIISVRYGEILTSLNCISEDTL